MALSSGPFHVIRSTQFWIVFKIAVKLWIMAITVKLQLFRCARGTGQFWMNEETLQKSKWCIRRVVRFQSTPFLSQDTQPHTAVENTSSPPCRKSRNTQHISSFIEQDENILQGVALVSTVSKPHSYAHVSHWTEIPSVRAVIFWEANLNACYLLSYEITKLKVNFHLPKPCHISARVSPRLCLQLTFTLGKGAFKSFST